MQECPRCGAYLKDDLKFCPYCSRNLDGRPPVPGAEEKRHALSAALERYIESVRLMTLEAPLGWNYEPLEMVTAQSVMGTGVIAEIGSSVTDFFGVQSETYRGKMKQGETVCRNLLRREALMKGAHAVIGIDVQYADFGGAKAMMMVSMSGTAVRLNDVSVLAPAVQDELDKAMRLVAQLEDLRA